MTNPFFSVTEKNKFDFSLKVLFSAIFSYEQCLSVLEKPQK